MPSRGWLVAASLQLACTSALPPSLPDPGRPSPAPTPREPSVAVVEASTYAAAPAPPPPKPENASTAEPSLSEDLGCGLHSPMPGAYTAGYAADTGLDLAGIRLPVHAIAAGTVVYAEAGHSLWASPRDTDLAVLVELDQPLQHGERRITHAWYAHLSALEFEQAPDAEVRRRVVAGERLGVSGVANGAWHLHLGLLLDGDTSQRGGAFLLEDGVRAALCGLRPRQRLPRPAPSAAQPR